MKRPDLETRLADDPVAAVLDLLREAGVATSASDIKAVARSRGGASIDTLWKKVQPTVRRHPNVFFEEHDRTYLWRSDGARPETAQQTPSAEEALAMLVKGGVRGASFRQMLGDVVRGSLGDERVDDNKRELREQLDKVRADLAEADQRSTSLLKQLEELKADRKKGGSPHDEYERAAKRRATRDHHARLASIRALAELAAQVEELASIGADSDTMIQYARSLVDSHGLEPIERAGAHTSYDPARHSPNGPAPKVGATVLVIRPGYTWNTPGEAAAELISKALVAEA